MFIASAEDWGLPKGYTKVEYIESTTDKEWFDTGLISSSSLRAEGKVYATPSTDDRKFVYGGETRSLLSIKDTTCFNIDKNGGWEVRCGTDEHAGLKTGVLTVTFDVDRSRAIINGETAATYSCSDYEASRTVYIFGINSATRVSANKGDNGLMRLYWLKFYSNNTLVRDFIPCLDTSGTACLFDRVNQTTYYNKGSGTVTYG